ncbi:hypothetical protein CYY_000348 [Polysphondylium violaceum]|uniref:UbiA prenyltransferase family protein n=1 Tax=Polysphondylium violaceum TaxID=133409 RepID=A0A8J4Q3U9_9MYCE|nr:hypothetical protein CYY_000348 [Polysphondylium violaceum]
MDLFQYSIEKYVSPPSSHSVTTKIDNTSSTPSPISITTTNPIINNSNININNPINFCDTDLRKKENINIFNSSSICNSENFSVKNTTFINLNNLSILINNNNNNNNSYQHQYYNNLYNNNNNNQMSKKNKMFQNKLKGNNIESDNGLKSFFDLVKKLIEKNMQSKSFYQYLHVCKVGALPVSMSMVVFGTALAFKKTNSIDLALFIFNLLFLLSMHCFGNLILAHYKIRSKQMKLFYKDIKTTDIEKYIFITSVICALWLLLIVKRISDTQLLYSFIVPCLSCAAIVLTILSGYPIDLKYGYDLAIPLVFILQIKFSFLCQAMEFNPHVLLNAIPIALVAQGAYYSNNIKNFEIDFILNNKKSLSKVLGRKNSYSLFMFYYLLSYLMLMGISYYQNRYLVMLPIVILPKLSKIFEDLSEGNHISLLEETCQFSFYFGLLSSIGMS